MKEGKKKMPILHPAIDSKCKRKKREGKKPSYQQTVLGINLSNSYQITKKQSPCTYVVKIDT